MTNKPSSLDRTLVLVGSPHKNGATARLLKEYLATVDGEVTVVDCFERAVRPCDDCGGCRLQPRCVKRDMDDVYLALEQADRLVFAAPVYNRSFPAPMKAVIDRFQCYWSRRFVHGIKPAVDKPKKAVLLTACGSDREDGNHLQLQLEPALTVLHVTELKTLHVGGTDGKVDWEQVTKALRTL